MLTKTNIAPPANPYAGQAAPVVVMGPAVGYFVSNNPNLNTGNSASQCIGKTTSTQVDCEFCQKKTETSTKCKTAEGQYQCCCLCSCMLCCILAWIPFVVPSCYEYTHYCSN